MDARKLPTQKKSLFDPIKKVLRVRHDLKVFLARVVLVDDSKVNSRLSCEELQPFSDSQSVEYVECESFGPQDVTQYAHLITRANSVKRHLLKASNAYIVGPYGLVVNRYHRLLTHRIGGVKRTALRSLDIALKSIIASFRKPTKAYPVAFNTHCLNTSNYFHWNLEFLAGLQGYEQACKHFGKRMPILLQAPYMRKQAQWMELMNYEYIEVPNSWDTNIRVENLYFGSNEFDTYCNLDASTTKWLRNRILASPKLSLENDLNLPKKLFINRRDSKKGRGIANADEIEAVLIEKGFTSIQISDYDAKDQVSLFNSAEIIVSEHGAALANVIFCSDCKIVEIFPCDYFNNDITVLALNTNNEYSAIFAHNYEDPNCPNMIRVSDLMLALESSKSKLSL